MENVPVDVATLSELSESSILSCLEERFSSQHFQVGDRRDSIKLFIFHACGMNIKTINLRDDMPFMSFRAMLVKCF